MSTITLLTPPTWPPAPVIRMGLRSVIVASSNWLGWVGRSGSRGCEVVEEVEKGGVDLGATLLLPACRAWLKPVWKLISLQTGKLIGFLTGEGEASG
ncbi:hypothetical protein [Streptomyces sp. AC555_RSS877]|uniref:hypothetical protein n=1 Tax=Streptomyces sp. AC555_RSS877 TaxID=2823688 RepID=UPI001C272E82|nr:hypothetical protein [Streptomyces sp. AC555_RSS877]